MKVIFLYVATLGCIIMHLQVDVCKAKDDKECDANNVTQQSASTSTSTSTSEKYTNKNKSYQTLELILAENYQSLDDKLPNIIQEIRIRGGHRCWHKHSTFLEHLLGVHNILRLWDVDNDNNDDIDIDVNDNDNENENDGQEDNQDDGQDDNQNQSYIISRVGLLHSVYSNSYVNLSLFNPNSNTERTYMKQMIGYDAEEIVYLFCIIDRQSVVVDMILKDGYIPKGGLYVPHIRNKDNGSDDVVYLSEETMLLLVIFTMADVADQYFSWQDELFGGKEGIHSMLMPNPTNGENEDDTTLLMHDSMALWPGSSKPGIWMYYASELGSVLKRYVDEKMSNQDSTSTNHNMNTNMNIPPVFNNCTQTLSREDEIKARDLYWTVIMDDIPSTSASTSTSTSSKDMIGILQEASRLNPWFFECHVMLAQKYLHLNEKDMARYESEKALDLQMLWGTAYDKRMSFPAWVAWTRVLYQRACNGNGNGNGNDDNVRVGSWPTNSWDVNNFGMVQG